MLETTQGTYRADLIAKAIVGQERVIDDVLLGLYCGDYVLLTGGPGLTKTYLTRSLAEALHLGFSASRSPRTSPGPRSSRSIGFREHEMRRNITRL